MRGQEAFFDLIEEYLALGLFVDAAGLGVTMIRAVRERRRGTGILPSGFRLPWRGRRFSPNPGSWRSREF